MFLVVQRVVTSEGEGINAFYHAHGPRQEWVWEPPSGIPDADPGSLERETIQVTGRGRVRSFLDIAAPDGTPVDQLRWAHDAILALLGAGAKLPLTLTSGPVFVRYDVESQLRQDWHSELHALLDVGLPLVP